MKITIVGAGYVGLSCSVCFAELGHKVYCIDIDTSKILKLKDGEIPIYEEGMKELLNKHKSDISFTSDYKHISDSDITFICVGTPEKSDGTCDLSYVMHACNSILPFINSNSKVVIKSTVPPKTCNNIEHILQCKLYNIPEFLREGSAIHDFFNTDRIIIGGIKDNNEKEFFNKLYDKLSDKIIYTESMIESELIKYVSNSFLAMKIHFTNEISNLCKVLGVDVYNVMNGVGADSRICHAFLNPSPCYGGSCFPKDTKELYAYAKSLDVDLSLIKTTIDGNDKRRREAVEFALKIIRESEIEDPKILILGLTFKPNTDDTRYSASVVIRDTLIRIGYNVNVYDPKAWACEVYIEEYDIILILTEWKEFYGIEDRLKGKIVIDYRHVINPYNAKFKLYTF